LITPGLTGTVTKSYDGTDVATLNPGNYTFSSAIDGGHDCTNGATTGNYDTPHVARPNS